MNAVPFDTLKMAQRLEDAGFTRPQAAGAAEALAEALVSADLATKGDVTAVKRDVETVRRDLETVRGEVETVRQDVETVRGDVNAVRGDLETVRRDVETVKAEVALVRTEIVNAESRLEARLNAAIELLRRDVTIKFGSMLMVAVGVILAAIRYLPPHP